MMKHTTLAMAAVLGALMGSPQARAEYGDVVMNNHSEQNGINPVVFPHWFHRARYGCKVCHSDLGMELEAGANGINMMTIMDGQHCGACHNGEIAWQLEHCDLCHSGKSGLETQVHGSTSAQLNTTQGEEAR
ncbi:c(7)-type cytochrome triheme domain-containing protein [Ferrimonas sediminicola]|nr:c(7)-type cytochrome triheme domain-containing protein [Ferrimonas sediminicola]